MEDKQITLQIDGHFITVPEGSTILEAATKIGINIPTLCHIDCFLSHLRGRGYRTPQSGSCLRYPLHGRNGSENQYATCDERTQSGS